MTPDSTQFQAQGAAPTPAPAPVNRNDRGRSLVLWVRDMVVSLAISAFIIVFVYQPVKVEGTSMLPGLQDQERIFINKFVYLWDPISRGDLIVFQYPRDLSKSYIKRVIALPGDHVQISMGRVYVNGERLKEPYVPAEYDDERSYPSLVVPSGRYFVLGDHRNLSSDSREFGPIERKLIYGKAVFAYWPAEKVGKIQ